MIQWGNEQISAKNAKSMNTCMNTWMWRKNQKRYGEVGLGAWNRGKENPNPKEKTKIDAEVVEKIIKECIFWVDPIFMNTCPEWVLPCLF